MGAPQRFPRSREARAARDALRGSTAAGIRKVRAKKSSTVTATRRVTRRATEDLVATLRGAGVPTFTPGAADYERSVAANNLLYRFTRPLCVVQPETVAQVREVVRLAKAKGVLVTVKNGGHSYSGSSFPRDGVLVDIKRMNKVRIEQTDPENDSTMSMVMEGGALWGNAYRALINEAYDGFVLNGGRCPTVGVSGFMLGGGLGPFSRSLGMGVDSLLEVTLVTADGRVVTVSHTDHPDSDEGMLFWALSGAGGGNFGIVTALKIKIHKLQDPDFKVTAGRFTWFPRIADDRRRFASFFSSNSKRAEETANVLATMNHFYTTAWPNTMTIDSSWLSDLEQQGGDLGIRFLAYFDGNEDDFAKHITKGVVDKDLAKQLKRRALPEASTRFLHETLFAQWDEETKRSTPANSTFRIFSSFCFTNERSRVESITRIVQEELEAFKSLFKGETSGLCQATFIHAGGATAKRPRSATSFRWRDCMYHAYIMLQWRDKWLERDMRGFCKKFKARLKPFSLTGKAAFIAFPDASLGSEDFEKAYYGNNRAKLQQVKRIWDGDDFFRWDQGVQLPEGSQGSGRGAAQDMKGALRMAEQQEEELSDAEDVDDERLTDSVAADRWDNRSSAPVFEPLTHAMDGDFFMLYGDQTGALRDFMF